jgi:hypothetical protein
MKKFLIVLIVILLSSACALFGFYWYATAKAQMRVISTNVLFFSQQLHLKHYQLTFDYDRLQIGSHYISPMVVMKKPVITFSTSDGVYHLRAKEIGFIGPVGDYDSYRIKLPGTLFLEKDGDSAELTSLRIKTAPRVKIRSTLEETKQTLESTIIDEIRIERGEKLTIELPNAQRLTYTPPPLLTAGWVKVRYDLYPYLNQFAKSVENALSLPPLEK